MLENVGLAGRSVVWSFYFIPGRNKFHRSRLSVCVSTMLLKVCLLFVAAATVTAQSKTCIPNASWSASSKRCECDTGFTGQPDLCCYTPTKYKACYVAGDPVLNSYTDHSVGLDFPCGTAISAEKVSSAMCEVNVFAASREMANGGGLYYTSQVTVQIRASFTTATYTITMGQLPSVTIRSTSTAETKTLAEGDNNLPTFGVTNSDVVATYDADLKLITFSPCGQVITLRPVSDNNAQQARTPGLCVVVPVSTFPNPNMEAHMCGLKQDLRSQGKTAYLNYAIKPMTRYLQNNLWLARLNDPSYLQECSNFKTGLSTCHSSDRQMALKKCMFLIFHGTVKRCVTEANNPNQLKAPFNAFLNCIRVYCDGTKTSCQQFRARDDIKACAPSLSNCNTWAPYRRVNQFVAGEGENQNLGQGELQGQDQGNNNQQGLVNGVENNDQNNSGGNAGFDPSDIGL